MSAVPVTAAAAILHISTPTLKRWIAAGAPVARRGRRGRGALTLVDPVAVEAWRASQCVTLAAAAAAIPDVVAEAMAAALIEAEGLPKQRMAGFLAGCWYRATTAVLDHLREHDPAVGDAVALPLAIERLRKISQR